VAVSGKREFEVIKGQIAEVEREIARLEREIERAERAVRKAVHFRERCVEKLRPHCPHKGAHREPVSTVASGGYRYIICDVCGGYLGEEYRAAGDPEGFRSGSLSVGSKAKGRG